MTLRSFFDSLETASRSLAVVAADDRAERGPLTDLLADSVDSPHVEVTAANRSIVAGADRRLDDVLDAHDTVVVALEDGEPIAASPMDDLYDAILAINSDLFMTGSRGLGSIELPAVLAALENTRLELRGYPRSHKEKLLLILLSRYIEQLAWSNGSGILRSSFQYLSRIEDEVGTRAVYDQLGRTDVDVHVYGVGGSDPPAIEATVHTGRSRLYRTAWFVVYRPDNEGPTDQHPHEDVPGASRSAFTPLRRSDGDSSTVPRSAALVCLETGDRVWEGFFTFDSDRVAAIEDTVATEL
ncbi:putative sensor protein [Natrialba hulunbeirensis JCM 10989]|uniref:Putative sensor protein n=1 Tax=Natrialba hulunbeirensis JCM 10989 TaxID=1227493 RepID=M0A7J0_9EURY|nr:hypothetical protein [Natrialba hulunbeirensis]ELY93308.1 putative sensor protein [Natrialba hulunbeirensis JCM 10989]